MSARQASPEDADWLRRRVAYISCSRWLYEGGVPADGENIREVPNAMGVSGGTLSSDRDGNPHSTSRLGSNNLAQGFKVSCSAANQPTQNKDCRFDNALQAASERARFRTVVSRKLHRSTTPENPFLKFRVGSPPPQFRDSSMLGNSNVRSTKPLPGVPFATVPGPCNVLYLR